MFVVPNYGAALLEAGGISLVAVGLVLGVVVATLLVLNAFRGSLRSKPLEAGFGAMVVFLGGGGLFNHDFLPLSLGVVLAVSWLAVAEYYDIRKRLCSAG
jgi:hypothetical protein